MQIQYVFESYALPELVVLTKGEPHVGDRLVNRLLRGNAGSFVVAKIVDHIITVKRRGNREPLQFAHDSVPDDQWDVLYPV